MILKQQSLFSNSRKDVRLPLEGSTLTDVGFPAVAMGPAGRARNGH